MLVSCKSVSTCGAVGGSDWECVEKRLDDYILRCIPSLEVKKSNWSTVMLDKSAGVVIKSAMETCACEEETVNNIAKILCPEEFLPLRVLWKGDERRDLLCERGVKAHVKGKDQPLVVKPLVPGLVLFAEVAYRRTKANHDLGKKFKATCRQIQKKEPVWRF